MLQARDRQAQVESEAFWTAFLAIAMPIAEWICSWRPIDPDDLVSETYLRLHGRVPLKLTRALVRRTMLFVAADLARHARAKKRDATRTVRLTDELAVSLAAPPEPDIFEVQANQALAERAIRVMCEKLDQNRIKRVLDRVLAEDSLQEIADREDKSAEAIRKGVKNDLALVRSVLENES